MATNKNEQRKEFAGGELNPDAPVASQDSEIRDAKHPDEKPDPTTVAQVEELKDSAS